MPWWQWALACTGAGGILVPVFLGWAWVRSTRPSPTTEAEDQ